MACDDWYQRRRQDAEGEFFRSVASQGPRKGEGTRQGIYCLTADGKLLAYKNAGQNADVTFETLQQGLAQWKRLYAQRRQPGAVQVPELTKVDERYSRTPPKDVTIVNVYTRALERDPSSGLTDAACQRGAGDEAARDNLWIRNSELANLAPAGAKVGDRFPLPPTIAERILRFHLVDSTRGEPVFWRPEDIRSSRMTLTVDQVTDDEITLQLNGTALLSVDEDPERSARGYDVRLLGYVAYKPKAKSLSRFDLLAIGEHWGDGPFTRRHSRPGRTPLGVAFSLAKGTAPGDDTPPQAARDLGEYLKR